MWLAKPVCDHVRYISFPLDSSDAVPDDGIACCVPADLTGCLDRVV